MATRTPGLLCLVTDGRVARGPLAAIVGQAVRAGVDWVQVRDRSLEGAELLSLVRAVQEQAPGAAVLVNRRVDVALAADAAGVHLGFDGMPPEQARELLGDDKRIGCSCHSLEEVRAARRACDYAHLAPIFEPLSKPGDRPPLGIAALAEACRAGGPVFAQGGITAANAAACMEAGAAGVAVTGEILMADDPAGATRALCEALGR